MSEPNFGDVNAAKIAEGRHVCFWVSDFVKGDAHEAEHMRQLNLVRGHMPQIGIQR
ncbi:hypothetical protein GCM10009424_21120 [Sphingomonas ursincola]